MRSIRTILAGLLVILTTTLVTSAQAADPSVTVSGVTFSWPEKIFLPIQSSTVTFSVTNNSGREILGANYELVNALGTTLAYDDVLYLKNGQTSYISNRWYGQGLSTNYVEPLKLVFYVDFYSSDSPDPAPVSIDFKFAGRPDVTPSPTPTVTVTATPAPAPAVTVTATPAPAPAVTVTATPAPAPTVTVTARPTVDGIDVDLLNAKISGINSQLKTLSAKLKRICAAKPKPKGC